MSGSLRENVGKKDAKALRREDKVPCVMYGKGEQYLFAVPQTQFQRILFNPEPCYVEIDLNGTKRAEALEAMARENMRRSRRRGKNGETTGSLGSNTGSVAPQPVAQQAAEGASGQQAAATEVDDSAPTAVMRDDSAPTQVLDPDAADATTLLEVTDPQQANANEGSQLKQVVEEERIPDNFEIVRKIVLTDSTEFIRPEQGEQYA